MKVLVASFQCESNSFAESHPKETDFEYFEGEDIFRKLVVKKIFTENGISVIPAIYANALPSGTVEKDIYEKYLQKILRVVEKNPDLEGIYIYVHGSMEVQGIGSGELYLLQKIRKIVSDTCLIALTMDLHANIPKEMEKYANIICAYKTAPHIDQQESQIRAAKALVYCLKHGVSPVTHIVKIPMLVKGDTMLTRYEPLKSLEETTRIYEQQEDVFGANLFFGHCWVDAVNTSASAVVSSANAEKAGRLAKELANRLWETRKQYKFLIEAESPQECVERAIKGSENRIFITDSGDNTTAGAEGKSLILLKMLLDSETSKKTCVAGITHKKIVDALWEEPDGSEVIITFLDGRLGRVKAHGEILGWAKEIIGRSLTISFGAVDVIFTELRSAFIEKGNFDKANVELTDYRIVVVKLGYLFEELKPFADRELFALTDGASCVELSRLPLQKIMRPMFPLEDFEWKA